MGRQWLGRYGKTDNGVVTVTTVWADERLYYPVDAEPYTPAKHFAKGKNDPGVPHQAADRCGPGGQGARGRVRVPGGRRGLRLRDQDGFRAGLADAGLPFVMALRPRRGTWARAADAHTPVEAARALAWGGPDDPGDWHPVTRTFRDGHAENLAGRRRHPRRVGTGRSPAPGRGHRRPGHPARTRRPGTWSPTCPAPAARARQAVRTPPPAWPRSRACTRSATGSSRATSRSRTSWAGPISRFAPIPRSAATRPW